MTIWYVDYEGGTNANASAGNGDSFATRRKYISNIVAAAHTPGDTIRVMASPATTVLGTCQWSGNTLPATKNIVSSTNATPIVVTVTAHGYSNGDTVIVAGHTTNTNASGAWEIAGGTADTFELVGSVGNGTGGASGTVRKANNLRVVLPSAVTQNIAACGNLATKPAWTASANVTATLDFVNFKEGGYCSLRFIIAAGFTTGKAAYYTLPATLDLSTYQQVSFWIMQTVGTAAAAGGISLKLCSDTTGDAPVSTIDVPAQSAANSYWCPTVVDTGSALGSSIQSIALYVNTDAGAQTFIVDNIIACKASSAADSLNLTSLIGKGIDGDGWWAIQSINGTRVMLSSYNLAEVPGASGNRGYCGASESVTTYKQETTKLPYTNYVNHLSEDGTVAARSSLTGGWNRTDMSTQTGETWLDGQITQAYVDHAVSIRSYWDVTKINAVRTSGCIKDSVGTGYSAAVGSFRAVACGQSSFGNSYNISVSFMEQSACAVSYIVPNKGSFGDIYVLSPSGGASIGSGCTVQNLVVKNSSSYGLTPTYGGQSTIRALTVEGCAFAGISNPSTGLRVLSGRTSGNQYGVNLNASTPGGASMFRNFTFGESTEVFFSSPYLTCSIQSGNHDGTANAKVFYAYGQIAQQSSVVHGGSTLAWVFSPTSSTEANPASPLALPIAQIAVAANALVTCTAWFRRSNTDLTGRLVCKGGQLSGVTTDVVAGMTVAADTWEQLTITFAPTEAGVIELEAQFYGGTTYNGYVSLEDASFTQA